MELDIKRKLIDVSAFFLCEATGDSEAGCSFDPAIANHVEDEDDDDDAESCSCDASEFCNPSSVRDQFNGLQEKVNVDDEEYEEDGEVVDQRKEVHLFEKCRNNQRSIDEVVGNQHKSTVSVDSSKTMNEMEKSRLFWEACLAS